MEISTEQSKDYNGRQSLRSR